MKTILALTLTLALATPALAHEMAHDGAVGGLLHIEPDDDPVVGKPNPTWFELTLRGGAALAPGTCTCTLNVYAGSYKPGAKAISSPPLKLDRGRELAAVTFPKAGGYTLVLSGKPKSGSAFAPFTLQWVVRADTPGS